MTQTRPRERASGFTEATGKEVSCSGLANRICACQELPKLLPEETTARRKPLQESRDQCR